jgi:hypothetical protein
MSRPADTEILGIGSDMHRRHGHHKAYAVGGGPFAKRRVILLPVSYTVRGLWGI